MKRHQALAYTILGIFLLVNLFPIYWMFVTSVKIDIEVYSAKPTLIPQQPTFRNYVEIFTTRPYFRYTFNTIMISLATTFFCVILGSVSAYGFSRFHFFGNKFWRYIIIGSRVFPPISLIVPFFILFGKLENWFGIQFIDTLHAQILVNTYMWLPFSIWIMLGFFDVLPRELDEAAKIDGCTRFQSFRKIIFPLAFPGIAATGIIAFMGTWNEFMFNLILAPTPAAKNLSVGASDFIADMFVSWNHMGAGAMIASLPAFIFIIFFQRYIVSGLVAGAIK
ncbi:sugar ABC transporter permease protein [Candidatus Vecturithrix granuli]|uniref:Sugar ABC transporter permease protein n=1 Tax=Vecturithrix granuli TaxID=1499967 RepID=A0A081C1P3_VECG1|nr:sugar ABC transporter permease protein [Candidatus Vecturithrix granuli]